MNKSISTTITQGMQMQQITGSAVEKISNDFNLPPLFEDAVDWYRSILSLERSGHC